MPYGFEPGRNAAKATKCICCVNDEGSVDLKKFRLGCKNLDDQVRWGRSKIVDCKAVLQVIEVLQVIMEVPVV